MNRSTKKQAMRYRDQTNMGGGGEAFLTTHWSLIEGVNRGEGRDQALISLLLHRYWKPLLLEAFEGLTHKLPPDHPDVLDAAHDLGVLYMKLRRFDGACPLLMRAFEGRRQKFGDDHPDTLDSLSQIITLYGAWGKPEEALKWQAKRPAQED
ncbi:MAG: tetratricopeptide repeat protein [Planctomycetes bacterium]|nr:tetratricopeptide repeat protein [Planctomycetota bacterium]